MTTILREHVQPAQWPPQQPNNVQSIKYKVLSIKYIVLCTFYFLLNTHYSFAQNLGVNATGATPNASSIIDLNTGNTFISPNGKGILPPNVALISITDAVTITAPATSLLVYNSATAGTGTAAVVPGYYYWNGLKWVRFQNTTSTAQDWSLLGNAGTTAGTNFLGTTDAQDVTFKTNGVENMRILNSNGNVGIGTTTPSAKLHVGGGNRWTVADIGSILLQSGTGGTGAARDWKIYVPMTAGCLSFRDMGFDNLNNGMTSDAMVIQYVTGNVGIGATVPTERLEVQGSVKIVDGTQGLNKVLTSDAAGKASWKNVGLGAPGTASSWSANALTPPEIYPNGSIQTYGPFTIPTSGWYILSSSRWFYQQNTVASADLGAASFWIQMNTSVTNLMDQPGQIYEYRGITNTSASCPPSGSFIYMLSGTNYYVHQQTNYCQSASTGERGFILSFVQ